MSGKISLKELNLDLNTKINKLDNFTEDANGDLLYKNKPVGNQVTLAEVQNFTSASQNEGTQIELSWTNPTATEFTNIELYVSTTNITNANRDYCNTNATLILSNGTSGEVMTHNHNSTVGVTYYFKIFTVYSSFGTPQYSEGKSANVTATDTTAPDNVLSFIAKAGNAQITLTWDDPSNADWSGTKIVRKTGGYPVNENDGVVVINSSVRDQYSTNGYIDTGLINDTTYYYQAFPYDSNGNVNRNVANRAETMPKAVQIYSVEWNKTTDTYTRYDNAMGKVAPSDFNSLMPWSGMRRCNLSDAGVVNAYYGDPTFKDDGTNGQVMVEIPKFWYKVETTANGYRWYIADNATSGFEVHPAFYRDRNNDGLTEEVSKRYYSAYDGVYHDGTSYINGNETSSPVTPTGTAKLCSISGYKPFGNMTIANFRTTAERRGNGWGITDFNLLYAVQLLYLVEYAHFDSQTKIGQGYTASSNTVKKITGGTNANGNSSYGEATGTLQMSYRGIEDFYGNVFDWIDGVVTDASWNILVGNKSFNDTGTGYTTYSKGVSANIAGYIGDIWGDKQLGFIIKDSTGSNTSKLYDYGYLGSARVAYFSGGLNSGLDAGAFALRLHYAASNSSWSIGARLCF